MENRLVDLLVVGRVTRPHGLEGSLHVRLETDSPSEVFVPGRELLVRGEAGECSGRLTVAAARPHRGGWLVSMEEIGDRSTADRYAGAYLWAAREELPPLSEGEFFLHDLIGLRVVDEAAGELGRVEWVYEVPSGPLLAVRAGGGETLIPFRRETVVEVDLASSRVAVRLPEGFLEAQG